jgi:dihydrofolate reductase
MRLTLNMFMSLDGVVQGGGGPGEDDSGGFQYGGWQAPFGDQEAGEWVMDFLSNADAILLGRVTYEIWVKYWPDLPDENPLAKVINGVPKYVVSNSLDHLDWDNCTLIRGDLATEIERLKGLPGRELQIWGSAALAQSLAKLNLIDEYQLWIYPLVLGPGKRLFDENGPAMTLRLIETRTDSTGITVNRYVPAGEVETGRVDEQ